MSDAPDPDEIEFGDVEDDDAIDADDEVEEGS